jgi:nitrogen fixation NifU-like protein
VLNNHTHYSKLKNSICGDIVKIYLVVEKDKIINFKYECESCIYCQASASLLSRNAKNKTVEKIKNFATQANNSFNQSTNSFEGEWKEFNKIMGKNNISRKECLLLPVKTTLDALNN